jgi:hypothetical protein
VADQEELGAQGRDLQLFLIFEAFSSEKSAKKSQGKTITSTMSTAVCHDSKTKKSTSA